jgi:hypothetical protein
MRYAVALSAVVVISAVATIARADDKADCSYLEIAATTTNKPSIDPELKPLEKKLTKPPFASWNTFHKQSGGPVALVKQKAEPLKLAQGAARILMRERTERKVELTIELDGSDGKRVLNNKQSVTVGEWSAWGHSVKDDGHILALTCK